MSEEGQNNTMNYQKMQSKRYKIYSPKIIQDCLTSRSQQSTGTFHMTQLSSNSNFFSNRSNQNFKQDIIKTKTNLFKKPMLLSLQSRLRASSNIKSLQNSGILNLDEELQQREENILEKQANTVDLDDPDAYGLNHNIYKNLESIQEKQEFYNSNKNSVFTEMLQNTTETTRFRVKKQKSQSQDFNLGYKSQLLPLLPRNFGIIGGKSINTKTQSLNVNFFGIGDQYARILGAGLKSDQLKDLTKIAIQNNRFTFQGIQQIANSLQPSVLQLNLQGNFLGDGDNIQPEIIIQINKKFAKLQELNLENNNLTDKIVKSLLLELKDSNRIQKLNLSKNKITDDSITSKCIVELYLHWNQLKAQSGKMIARALSSNSTLQVLDLSFNSLGFQPNQNQPNNKQYKKELSGSVADAWSDYLKSNDCTLCHLDLSHNQFSKQASESISDSLMNNHVIFGFHFEGNANNFCSIDSKGFLILPIEYPKLALKMFVYQYKQIQQYPVVANYRRIDGVMPVQKPKDVTNQICWICDGWVEQQITWEPLNKEFHGEPVFVHFSNENYAPVIMVRDQIRRSNQQTNRRTTIQFNIAQWKIKRMFPPNETIKFFFTCPLTKQSGVSKCHEKIKWDSNEKNKKVVFYCSVQNKIKILSFHRPIQANVLRTGNKQQILKINNYGNVLVQISCLPRVKESNAILTISEEQLNIKEENHETENYGDFFQDCTSETDELYNECFLNDWNKSAIPALIKSKEEQAEVRDFLRTIYTDIVNAYRSVSSISPCGDIWAISLNPYTELFEPLIADKIYGLKDMDLQFKQTTSKHKLIVRQQAQLSLIRFQFMEIIVRLAIDKYQRNDPSLSVIESLKRMYIEDQLEKKFQSYEQAQEWRDEVYFQQENNQYIAKYKELFQCLYDQAYKFRVLNYFTTIKFVTPSAFRELFINAKMIGQEILERNINLAYILSVFPHKDEVTQDRQMQMNLTEFIEAIFRIADKINLDNLDVEKDDSFDGEYQLVDKVTYVVTNLAKSYNITVPSELQQIKNDSSDDELDDAQEQDYEAFRQFLAKNASLLNYEIDGTPAEKKIKNSKPF